MHIKTWKTRFIKALVLRKWEEKCKRKRQKEKDITKSHTCSTVENAKCAEKQRKPSVRQNFKSRRAPQDAFIVFRQYLLLRLLRRLECNEHRLGVRIARVGFVAMLHVAILREQGLDGVEASMQRESADENPWSAVTSDKSYHLYDKHHFFLHKPK